MKDMPIVSAATGYTSDNGRKYILVFNETLYIKEMQHTLINPNQCRRFGAEIQDNPYDANKPMAVISPDSEFTACLQSEGMVILSLCPKMSTLIQIDQGVLHLFDLQYFIKHQDVVPAIG